MSINHRIIMQKKKFKLEIENCKQIIEDNKNLINNGSFTAKIHYDKMKAGQIKHFWKNDVWAVNTQTKKDVSKNVLEHHYYWCGTGLATIFTCIAKN